MNFSLSLFLSRKHTRINTKTYSNDISLPLLKDASNYHWIFFLITNWVIYFFSSKVVNVFFPESLIKLCALADLLIRNRLLKTGFEMNLYLVRSTSY